jgi:hypothetical protein
VTGTLQGTVTDTSGGVLPGVTIAVRGTDTGLERTLVTNEKGFYNAPFLPIGRYQVRASLSGFGTVLRDKVDVRLNDTHVVDFTLGPQVAEVVTARRSDPPSTPPTPRSSNPSPPSRSWTSRPWPRPTPS